MLGFLFSKWTHNLLMYTLTSEKIVKKKDNVNDNRINCV